MTCSMTAFARVQNQTDSTMLCWELKSVNHRYLEVIFRLPESFRFLEASLRNRLKGQIHRGKVECQLKVTNMGGQTQSMVINEDIIQNVLKVGQRLSDEYDLANDLTVDRVLCWPGVVEASQQDAEALSPGIEQLFQEGLDQLFSVRQTEGEALKNLIIDRLQALRAEIEYVVQDIESIRAQARDKLLSRLKNLQLSVNEARLEQELALILARLDISEELDRLKTHVNEVEHNLTGNKPVGRRLDFLMQELNREANTLSSKSDSAPLTQHAVEMKVLIEQMREQIQNLE